MREKLLGIVLALVLCGPVMGHVSYDVNQDGYSTSADFVLWEDHWSTGQSFASIHGDINNDESIDEDDARAWLSHFGICPGDCNLDGVVDDYDWNVIESYLDKYSSGSTMCWHHGNFWYALPDNYDVDPVIHPITGIGPAYNKVNGYSIKYWLQIVMPNHSSAPSVWSPLPCRWTYNAPVIGDGGTDDAEDLFEDIFGTSTFQIEGNDDDKMNIWEQDVNGVDNYQFIDYWYYYAALERGVSPLNQSQPSSGDRDYIYAQLNPVYCDTDFDAQMNAVFAVVMMAIQPGDANCDGSFNSDDYVRVWVAGEYQDGTGNNSMWSEGDWDGTWDYDWEDDEYAGEYGSYENLVIGGGAEFMTLSAEDEAGSETAMLSDEEIYMIELSGNAIEDFYEFLRSKMLIISGTGAESE